MVSGEFRTLSKEEVLQLLSIAGGIFFETGKMSHEAATATAEKMFDTKKVSLVYTKTGVIAVAYKELSTSDVQQFSSVTTVETPIDNTGDPRECSW